MLAKKDCLLVPTENLPEEKEEEDVEELWWDDGNYDICDSTSSGVDARYSPVDFLSPSITGTIRYSFIQREFKPK